MLLKHCLTNPMMPYHFIMTISKVFQGVLLTPFILNISLNFNSIINNWHPNFKYYKLIFNMGQHLKTSDTNSGTFMTNIIVHTNVG
jgi:hypothetical protein